MPGMNTFLAIAGVTFGAFWIWLTVRIINRREHRTIWTTVGVGLPLLYVASFCPAMWLMGLMLKFGWISEGGQVLFLVLYYPICRMLGY
jgi:hypothetical protein